MINMNLNNNIQYIMDMVMRWSNFISWRRVMDNFSHYREARQMEDLLLESLEDWNLSPEDIMEVLQNLEVIDDLKRDIRKKVLVINN